MNRLIFLLVFGINTVQSAFALKKGTNLDTLMRNLMDVKKNNRDIATNCATLIIGMKSLEAAKARSRKLILRLTLMLTSPKFIGPVSSYIRDLKS